MASRLGTTSIGAVVAPAVDTPSGGRHIYFRQPEGAPGNREGKAAQGRGINIGATAAMVAGALRADGEGAYQPVTAGAIMAAPLVLGWLMR